jgi:hypothetical protein|tara:strand:+ start:7996 stop:8574 length:579 start_codon:yes stop_codon:yes gene_type:complete
MNKNKNLDKSTKKNNILNDFTKKNIFKYMFSGNSILNYKLIFYWLPPLIFVFILISFIFITNSESEYFISVISGVIIYVAYFLIDVIYQFILCKKTNKINLIINSMKNALLPSIFVFVGYLLSTVLRDVKKCNIQYRELGIEHTNIKTPGTIISRLINIHRNNIIVSIFFYLFSIIYNNPVNKKKCSNNNLC